MCNFLSALVLKNGDVLHSALLDSHADLVTLFGLPDGHLHHQHFAKVELTPPDEWKGWEDLNNWRFRLDEDTAPGWWDDVKVGAEEAVRNIIRRAILPAGEKAIHTDGLLIVGPGVTVRSVYSGRVFCCGGTLSDFRGGTLSNFWGGTLSDFCGGTLSNFCGGTLSNFWGGTLSDFWGGTLSDFRGGTLSNFRGGTLSNFCGGTLAAIRDDYDPTILRLAKGVRLNPAFRKFIASKPKKATVRKSTQRSR